MGGQPELTPIPQRDLAQGNFPRGPSPLPLLGNHCPVTARSGPSSPSFFAAMEASQPSHVNVEVTHAQSPPTDLVAGHVAPDIAQGTNAPARKRTATLSCRAVIWLTPSERNAPGSTVAARSARPPAEKMRKVSVVKRKKVPTKRSAPSSTPTASAGCSPTMPFNDVASTAGEVFDEMAGMYASSIPCSCFAFRHCGSS
ncbi:hypothetical protein D1007_56668 [Hordeum vulgare]|nr:hypothetical protein D1007_56668 [Hordeum vulgare]